MKDVSITILEPHEVQGVWDEPRPHKLCFTHGKQFIPIPFVDPSGLPDALVALADRLRRVI